MSSAIVTDTDEEMAKYDEARLLAENHPPLAAMKNKKTAYNTETGKTEILMTLEGGGYVKVGEEPKDRTREIKGYAQDLQSMGQPFDINNFTSAGYTEDEIMAAGVMPQGQEKTGRTDPLTKGEQLLVRRSGGDLAMPREQTKREEDRFNLLYPYEEGSEREGELNSIFTALGIDEFTARQMAEGIFGNPNSTRGDLGFGIADFTPQGLFYGAEEGVQTYQRGRNSGDNVMAAMGALEAGLSFAEAVPVTAAAAKGIKKNIPALRAGIEELGKRLNQPGDMPTVGSMGGNVFAPGNTSTTIRSEGGLPIVQEKGDENLRLHTNRITAMSDGKAYPGAPKNPRTVIKAPEGSNLPDVVVGNIKPEDWQQRIETAMSPDEINKAATWYKTVFGEFQNQADGDPEDIARLTDAWFAGQQNSSPGQTLNDVLFVYEQIKRGVSKEQLKGKGLPSANKIVIDILTQSEITGGAGQKIADFLDAGYGKNVRAIMGNKPEGGSPFVVDIHTGRDTGLVDKTFINHLNRLGYDVPKDLIVDLGGGGIKGAQYENRALFGQQLTQHLNDQNWIGRSDWEPAEIQAIGWMQLSGMYGTPNVGGNIQDAFTTNTRRISMESDPGEGSPFAEKFGQDLANLSDVQLKDINDKVTSKAIELVNKELGITLGTNVHGTGGWELFQNPSTVQQAIASKDAAIEAGARLGYLLQQTEVWVNAPKAITQNPKDFMIDILETNGNSLRDSERLKDLFEQIIENDPDGLFKGYQPITQNGQPGIRIIIPYSTISESAKAAKAQKRNVKVQDLLDKVQSFANTELGQITDNLNFDAEVSIMEADLTRLGNKWTEDKSGGGYKSYFSRQSGQDATREGTDSGVLDNDAAELEKFYADTIEEAKRNN